MVEYQAGGPEPSKIIRAARRPERTGRDRTQGPSSHSNFSLKKIKCCADQLRPPTNSVH